MNQSRSTGGGAKDMRLDRLHALEKGLELWYYQAHSTKARQLSPLFISKLIQITQQTNVRHLLSDADHAARNSLS